jgi:Ferritin-like
MLHLTLTGNLLCALGGSMDLYDYDVIPQYPGHILVEKIDMNLDRANKENLECFLQVCVDTYFSRRGC